MAVRVRISPWIRMRSRIVCAMESRTVARLPPTCAWIWMAVTMSSRSSDATRRTRLLSAGCSAIPSCISRTTRLPVLQEEARGERADEEDQRQRDRVPEAGEDEAGQEADRQEDERRR